MELLSSYFDERTGKSIVVIKHKKKIYEGTAKLHPEDVDKASKYAGCRFAEIRAEIQALKVEHRKEKAACEEIHKFVRACTQYKNFDETSPTAKAIYRQLHRRIKRVNDLADLINQKLQDLEIAIKQKEIIGNALEKRQSLRKVKNNDYCNNYWISGS